MARVLIAKTSLDGHWRGVNVVARGLRDAGFEVILGGEMLASDIAATAEQEDIDLIGLNVGGRVEVAERIIATLSDAGLGDIPVFAGGTLPSSGIERLAQLSVQCFPPGSSMKEIVSTAVKLTQDDSLDKA